MHRQQSCGGDPMTGAHLIDCARTTCLCDVGQPDYIAATAISADGAEHLVLAERDAINAEDARYDSTCSAVAHEQTGPLPLEFVRRLTAVARRLHRCGRRTASGGRCRIIVSRPGDACGWHRAEATS
jgi:hypothetical protein